jgi:hypothetical protein
MACLGFGRARGPVVKLVDGMGVSGWLPGRGQGQAAAENWLRSGWWVGLAAARRALVQWAAAASNGR